MNAEETNPSPTPAAPPPTSELAPARPARPGWGVSLVAATLAGLLAWAGGEWAEAANQAAIVSEFTVSGASQFARRAAVLTTRATLAHGILGALLGAALGLVGGLAARSTPRALAGAGLGLVLGAVAGAVAARIGVPLFLRHEDTQAEDLLLSLLTHAGLWSALGATAGLALGVGLEGFHPRALRPALGGLAGALLATPAYESAGALLFPLDQTGQPISEGVGSRLLARLVVALAVSAVAVQSARSAKPPGG